MGSALLFLNFCARLWLRPQAFLLLRARLVLLLAKLVVAMPLSFTIPPWPQGGDGQGIRVYIFFTNDADKSGPIVAIVVIRYDWVTGQLGSIMHFK